MIPDGALIVDAIGRDLTEDLAPDNAPAPGEPRVSVVDLAQHRPQREEPEPVGEIVVAGPRADLQISEDEAGVLGQGREEAPLSPLVERRRLREQEVRPEPVDGADGGLHRARPVHAESGRVRRHPALPLGDERGGVSRVAREPVGLAESHPLVAARELPDQADVGRAREVQVVDRGVVAKLPVQAGDRVAMPIDRVAEIDGAPTQQRNAMAAHLVGGARRGRHRLGLTRL